MTWLYASLRAFQSLSFAREYVHLRRDVTGDMPDEVDGCTASHVRSRMVRMYLYSAADVAMVL